MQPAIDKVYLNKETRTCEAEAEKFHLYDIISNGTSVHNSYFYCLL